MLQTAPIYPGFTPSYIYYAKRALDAPMSIASILTGSVMNKSDQKIQELAHLPMALSALTVPHREKAQLAWNMDSGSSKLWTWHETH